MAKFVCHERSYRHGLSDLRALLRKQATGLALAGVLPQEANDRVCELIAALMRSSVTAMTYGRSVEIHLHADGQIRILPPGREAQYKRAEEIILRP